MRAWMCTTIWSLYDESCAILTRNSNVSGSRASAESGRGVSLGFLVSGAAQLGDRGAKTRQGYVVGSAFSAGAHFAGKGVCDAGCLSAPRNSVVVRKI